MKPLFFERFVENKILASHITDQIIQYISVTRKSSS